MHAIEVKNLSYSYANNLVLEHVSFSVEEGTYAGIIGPNGGGKTTLLKLILGLIKPQSGTIKIFDQDIKTMNNKYEIGYVPQRSFQDNNFPATVYEIVASGRTVRKHFWENQNENDEKAIKEAMEIAHIIDLKNRLIHDLSGGQRQRVQVARALASRPKLLLLDEPFVGVDIGSQQEFYKFLKVLNETHHITILFVSHDIDIISQEVKEIICLNKRLVCAGPAQNIREGNFIENLYGKKITHIHHEHI